MEPKDYIVTKIEGEYAYLGESDKPGAEELFIALALLPEGSDVGSRLLYTFPEFSLI